MHGSNNVFSPLDLGFHCRQLKLPFLEDSLVIPGVCIGFALGIVEGSACVGINVCFVRRFCTDGRAGTEAEAENGWTSAENSVSKGVLKVKPRWFSSSLLMRLRHGCSWYDVPAARAQAASISDTSTLRRRGFSLTVDASARGNLTVDCFT